MSQDGGSGCLCTSLVPGLPIHCQGLFFRAAFTSFLPITPLPLTLVFKSSKEHIMQKPKFFEKIYPTPHFYDPLSKICQGRSEEFAFISPEEYGYPKAKEQVQMYITRSFHRLTSHRRESGVSQKKLFTSLLKHRKHIHSKLRLPILIYFQQGNFQVSSSRTLFPKLGSSLVRSREPMANIWDLCILLTIINIY